MAHLIRERDWSATPLGPIEDWPSSLKIAADMVVACGFPMLLLWGRDLIQLYNDACRALLGDKHPASLGQRAIECWPELRDFLDPIFERVLRGETVTFRDQLIKINRHGYEEETWFTLCHSPVHDAAGRVGGVLVTMFEKTAEMAGEAARSRAEEAVKASERRYRALAHATANSLYRLSADGTQLIEVYGGRSLRHYTEKKPSLEWLADYVHPDHRHFTLSAWRKAIETGAPVELEHLARRSDGAWGWVQSRTVPVKDEAGNVVEWIGSATDVSERKAVEEALLESEERFRSAFNAVGIGMGQIDAEGRYINVNRHLCEMLGYGPEELIGFTPYDFTHPDDREENWRGMQRLLSGEIGDYRIEKRLMRKNGEALWVSVHASPIRDAEGKVIAAVGIIVDLTERKRAEEQNLMLTREVNHRAKNLLSVVQAVARQTIGIDCPRGADRFNRRIAGLAASHDLLVKSAWRGVALDDLVRSQISHFRDLIGSRILLDGPLLRLRSGAAQSIGMALHELATNAGKYGALSKDWGLVRVIWQAVFKEDELCLIMRWSEHDGPPVKQPARKGFGHRVLVDMVEYALDADVRLDFTPTGLVWELAAPAENVLEKNLPAKDESAAR
jgi:PAS domain S-box-containing protein